MSVVEKIALGLTLLFLVVVCLRLFAAPLKLALKVVFNSALGFGALWLQSPGFGLLLLVQWVLT